MNLKDDCKKLQNGVENITAVLSLSVSLKCRVSEPAGKADLGGQRRPLNLFSL